MRNFIIIILFDIFVNSIVFLPVGNRDELTDYFVVLPAILLLNLFICWIYFRKKGKLGCYFAANIIIEAFLFVAIHDSICRHMAATYSTDYFFSDSINSYRIEILNRSEYFSIWIDDRTVLCGGSYDRVDNKCNLYISTWSLSAEKNIESSNDYPRYTLFIEKDTLYNWSEKPIGLGRTK